MFSFSLKAVETANLYQFEKFLLTVSVFRKNCVKKHRIRKLGNLERFLIWKDRYDHAI